jgi:hypothetical protein
MENCTTTCSEIVNVAPVNTATVLPVAKNSAFPLLPIVGGGLGAGGILGGLFASQSGNSQAIGATPSSPGVSVPLEDSAFSLSFPALFLLIVWRMKWKRKNGTSQSLKSLE